MNPRSTDCEADALTTTPSPRLATWCDGLSVRLVIERLRVQRPKRYVACGMPERNWRLRQISHFGFKTTPGCLLDRYNVSCAL